MNKVTVTAALMSPELLEETCPCWNFPICVCHEPCATENGIMVQPPFLVTGSCRPVLRPIFHISTYHATVDTFCTGFRSLAKGCVSYRWHCVHIMNQITISCLAFPAVWWCLGWHGSFNWDITLCICILDLKLSFKKSRCLQIATFICTIQHLFMNTILIKGAT